MSLRCDAILRVRICDAILRVRT
eukprot:COSAG01_NODE_64937_length_274_cov_76.908571_1_plen_22_part_01